jgi:RimJ/RimL family protein N-acetyltransferase
MPATIELLTPRLVLRAWRDEDKAPFARMNADPEVMEYFPSVMNREQSDGFVERMREHFAEHGWGFWALALRDTGELIGYTGLRLGKGLSCSPCFEAGWRLARVHWGAGYASEAAGACLDFAFNSLAAEEVVAVTALANVRSQAVMRRIGMRCDPAREFDHPRVSDGHPLKRHCLYSVGSGDWRLRRNG